MALVFTEHEDLSGEQLEWFPRRIVTSGTTLIMTQVTLPPWVEVVRISPETNSCQVAKVGPKGATMGDHFVTVAANGTLPFFRPVSQTGPWIIFLTAVIVSTNIGIDPVQKAN